MSRAAQVGSNLEESVDSNGGGIDRSILRASKKDQQRSRSKRHLAAKLPGRKGEKGSSPALGFYRTKGARSVA